MALIGVVIAAVVGFGLGAVWYFVFGKVWVGASGVPVDASGRPARGGTPLAFAGAFLCILLVAGMLRHTMAASGVVTPGAGLVTGLGVGLFFIAPWITLNTIFALRPLKLAAIDGGYAAAACAAMGLVLGLFL